MFVMKRIVRAVCLEEMGKMVRVYKYSMCTPDGGRLKSCKEATRKPCLTAIKEALLSPALLNRIDLRVNFRLLYDHLVLLSPSSVRT